MLFRNGRILDQTNNTPYSNVLHDVSAYTYSKIIDDLKYLNASFDEETMLPHEGQIPPSEEIPILVKWLSDNWPGCEHLGDGEMLTVASALEYKQSGTSVIRPEKPFPVNENAEASSQSSANKLWCLAITVGVVLLVSLAAWLQRKAKVPS